MIIRNEHVRHVVFILWILFCTLEQLTQDPLWGALRECLMYIMYYLRSGAVALTYENR